MASDSEIDLYGVSDDESLFSGSDTYIPADDGITPISPVDADTPATFLNLPYELRVALYEDILSKNNIEFFLHVDSALFCPSKKPFHNIARICLIHRPQEDVEAHQEKAHNKDMGCRTGSGVEELEELPPAPLTYVASLWDASDSDDEPPIPQPPIIRQHTVEEYPTPQAIAKQREREPYLRTFLSLLASCRQVRLELSELFWKRTQLHVGLEYGVTSLGNGPELTVEALEHRFANAKLGDQIHTLNLEFHPLFPKNHDNRTMPKVGQLYLEMIHNGRETVRALLKNLPSLRNVEIYVGDMSLYGILNHHGMFDAALKVLANNFRLQHVHLRGSIEDSVQEYIYVVEEWQRLLQANVDFEISPPLRHTGWPDCLHRFFYFSTMKQFPGYGIIDWAQDPILTELEIEGHSQLRAELLAADIRLQLEHTSLRDSHFIELDSTQ